MLTDPVQSQASSLTAIKTRAVRTDAYVARRNCLPYVAGGAWTGVCILPGGILGSARLACPDKR